MSAMSDYAATEAAAHGLTLDQYLDLADATIIEGHIVHTLT